MTRLDWQSTQSHVLLNPQMPRAHAQVLLQMAEQFAQPGHVWIASSGSAQKSTESVKLIALSKQAFLAAAAAVNRHLQVGSDDIWIQALPRFHVGGLAIEARAHLSGSRWIELFPWSAEHFCAQVHINKASLASLVPTQIYDLLQAGLRPPPTLRAIFVGGAALSPVVYAQARLAGWPILTTYGMTELCSQLATAPLSTLQNSELLSIPPSPSLQVLSHCQVRLDAHGFLQVASPALLTGFAQQHGKSQLWHQPVHNGWYTTQDCAQIIPSGEEIFLQPLGRGEDFIKINGEGINLMRLREFLLQVIERVLPQSFLQMGLELTVMDLPDPRRGAELVLVVSTIAENQLGENLIAKIMVTYNGLVNPVEKIQRWVKVTQIPRSALGKIHFQLLPQEFPRT